MPRTDAPRRYAIRGGKEGKGRLDVLARVLLPTTAPLLERVAVIAGMKCLDAGCGGGHVTILMARIVGPEGRVIGTDTDPEILALAREDAEAAKITNVEFQQQDACACLWHSQFDVTYARFLLSHLNIGLKLPTMLRKAGIREVELNVIQPAHIHGEGKLMAPLTMARISNALITEGLVSEIEVQQILTELNHVAADSETLISLPRIFQVWGKR